MAASLTSLAEVERELGRLRSEEEAGPMLRTSVMTHSAWVPPEWLAQAEATLEGLGERHPSRTIILVPEPDSERDAIEGAVRLERFSLGQQSVCTEVVEITLLGAHARAPASVLVPLLVADLPVFLRWRGFPFDWPQLEQLVEVADRVIVDSGEWPVPADGYRRLVSLLDRSAWSDIAWARTLPWRRVLAGLWPEIAAIRQLDVTGPAAESALLAGWLRSRLGREVELVQEGAESVERVLVDGEPVPAPPVERQRPSDLLSDELDRFGHDPIYEQAVTRAAAAT